MMLFIEPSDNHQHFIIVYHILTSFAYIITKLHDRRIRTMYTNRDS